MSLYRAIPNLPKSSLPSEFAKVLNLSYKLSGIPLNIPYIAYYNAEVLLSEGVLQRGPQCGIVALWMARNCFQGNSSLTVEAIQNEAVSSRFSNLGEMFCVENMANLARKCLSNCIVNVLTTNSTLLLKDFVVKKFCDGKAVGLIPYDTDGNHQPCLRHGHKAHWGLILGVVLPYTGPTHKLENVLFSDVDSPLLYHCQHSGGVFLPYIGDGESSFYPTYVIVRQGKCLRPLIMSCNELVASNINLSEVASHLLEGGSNSLSFPDHGLLDTTMANKWVLLESSSFSEKEYFDT